MGIIENMEEYIRMDSSGKNAKVEPPIDEIIGFIKNMKPECWNPSWK